MRTLQGWKPCWRYCPVSAAFTGIELDGDVAAAGSDFEVLEILRKLAFTEHVDAPQQLEILRNEP